MTSRHTFQKRALAEPDAPPRAWYRVERVNEQPDGSLNCSFVMDTFDHGRAVAEMRKQPAARVVRCEVIAKHRY